MNHPAVSERTVSSLTRKIVIQSSIEIRSGRLGEVDWIAASWGAFYTKKTKIQKNVSQLNCLTESFSNIFNHICYSSISYKYPSTTGATYPTTVPHSQSHAAGNHAHLDPTCQSHSTYPALCHGVSLGGTMGGLGRQHSCWGDRVAGPRPHPGKRHNIDCSFYIKNNTRL